MIWAENSQWRFSFIQTSWSWENLLSWNVSSLIRAASSTDWRRRKRHLDLCRWWGSVCSGFWSRNCKNVSLQVYQTLANLCLQRKVWALLTEKVEECFIYLFFISHLQYFLEALLKVSWTIWLQDDSNEKELRDSLSNLFREVLILKSRITKDLLLDCYE